MSKQTMAEILAGARARIDAGNQEDAARDAELATANAKAAELEGEIHAIHTLGREKELRARLFGGLHLAGERRNNLQVIEELASWWQGDRVRVQCLRCGRTADIDGDDWREEITGWTDPGPGMWPTPITGSRVTSCRDFPPEET